MNKIIRYYNQNRWEIILIIIIIVFGFLLLHSVNHKIKEERAENSTKVDQTNLINQNQNKNEKMKSIIGEEKEENNNEHKVIQKFIEYCNEKNINEAYELLSNECKEELYPNVQRFESIYYKEKFKTIKTCKIEKWVNSTYRIQLNENALETGNIKKEKIEDYITVKNENGVYKLNINGYIGKIKIGKKIDENNLTIEIIEKKIYMNYETYDITVKNNNNEDIVLDNLEHSNSIYLTDENNIKHVAYIHELIKEDFKIEAKREKNIKIKFDNPYIYNRTIKKINFSNVIINNNIKDISINFL